jgi:hypothetical protein
MQVDQQQIFADRHGSIRTDPRHFRLIMGRIRKTLHAVAQQFETRDPSFLYCFSSVR